MKIGLLKYSKGFTLDSFLQFANILENIDVENIYISSLLLNPLDFNNLTTDVLLDLPMTITDKIGPGFSEEMISWLKKNMIFSNPPSNEWVIKDKIGTDQLSIIILEGLSEEMIETTMGRTNQEHIDKNMLKLEVSIDDLNPEIYSYLFPKLFELGANDVYIDQVIMKKNRPGHILHILCQQEKKEGLISFLFKETTTLGIRYTPYIVHRLEREFITVLTEWGKVTLKVGKNNGEIVQAAPEYDQCAAIANKYDIPIKYVYEKIKYYWLQNELSNNN